MFLVIIFLTVVRHFHFFLKTKCQVGYIALFSLIHARLHFVRCSLLLLGIGHHSVVNSASCFPLCQD